jgi:hypothetical protein
MMCRASLNVCASSFSKILVVDSRYSAGVVLEHCMVAVGEIFLPLTVGVLEWGAVASGRPFWLIVEVKEEDLAMPGWSSLALVSSWSREAEL